MLKELVETYPENVQIIYRHFPLEQIHDNSRPVSIASEAAALQDQFWPFHDMLFDKAGEWASLSAPDLNTFLIKQAGSLGLDTQQFEADLTNPAVLAKVEQNSKDAINLQLPGTPSIIVDGQVVAGQSLPFDAAVWKGYIDETLTMATLLEKQYDAPPEMSIDSKATYLATVKLANGKQFVMELYPQSAPQTVNSFVFLASEGWFDGVTFHRVIPGFVAQTGDPSGTGRGGPGYTIPNEVDKTLSHAESGMVAMANSGPDTNGSQWYITLGDAAFLDGGYTIFGRVVEGFDDAVMSITARDPADPNAPEGDKILTIEISKR